MFILIAGVTVILIGVVLIFTPGPAIVVIPAGIAILATEFVWARKLLARFKASALSAANAALGKYPPDASGSLDSDAHLVFYRRYWRRLCQVIRSGVAPFRKGYIDAHRTGSNDSATPHDPPTTH